jgi:transcriptional regulator with XRE-family HTH domain
MSDSLLGFSTGQSHIHPGRSNALMRLEGRIWKDGAFWLVEIPILDAVTQGRSRREALEMAGDLVDTLADADGFRAEARQVAVNRIELSSNDSRRLVALVLRRQRQKHGLSLADVARRLHARSRNTYARYEQGRSVPTIEKLAELLEAVSEKDLVIRQSGAWSLSHRRILIADATGKSEVTEYSGGAWRFMRNDRPWQVATNTLLFSVPEETLRSVCRRYRAADDYLEETNGIVTWTEGMTLLQTMSQYSTQ